MPAQDVHQLITDRMIEALEKGTVPWHRPWATQTGGVPRSMSTRKAYRGINPWLLTMTSLDEGYTSPWWGSYDKIAELSGMAKDPKTKRWVSPDGTPRGVRKGERGTRVIWWEAKTRPDPDNPDEPRTFMVGGTRVVFNATQADQLPPGYHPEPGVRDVGELPEPEAVLMEYAATRGPELAFIEQGRAYYQSGPDRITMPTRAQFDTAEEFFGTWAHESAHSTGHAKRLNRPGVASFDHFGSERYAKEELIAEMSSAILAEMTGVGTDSMFDNSAAYISSWLKELKNDVKLVGSAASSAQAAVDYITGVDSTVDTEDVLTAA
jgi:antirestriction protein ArdC